MLPEDIKDIRVANKSAKALYHKGIPVWLPNPPWSPAWLGGLTVWFDATKLTGPNVTQWKDLSGRNNNGTVFGSPAPQLRLNALNGLPVVQFTALQGRVRGNPIAGANYTVAYVTRMVGPTVGRIFTSNGAPQNVMIGYHSSGYETGYDNGYFGPRLPYTTLPLPWTAWIATGFNDGSASATWIYKNGVPIAPVWTRGLGLAVNYNLSGYSTGTQETCDCEVAELLIYDHPLNDIDRLQVESYFKSKWGVPNN